MGETTSGIAGVLSEVMASVTTVTANPLVATALAIPVTGGIIFLVKKLFRRG